LGQFLSYKENEVCEYAPWCLYYLMTIFNTVTTLTFTLIVGGLPAKQWLLWQENISWFSLLGYNVLNCICGVFCFAWLSIYIITNLWMKIRRNEDLIGLRSKTTFWIKMSNLITNSIIQQSSIYLLMSMFYIIMSRLIQRSEWRVWAVETTALYMSNLIKKSLYNKVVYVVKWGSEILIVYTTSFCIRVLNNIIQHSSTYRQKM
jgi:hypothetical protein